jgi:hypothetical protein
MEAHHGVMDALHGAYSGNDKRLLVSETVIIEKYNRFKRLYHQFAPAFEVDHADSSYVILLNSEYFYAIYTWGSSKN